MLHLIQSEKGFSAKPLEILNIAIEANEDDLITVVDGAGEEYFRSPAPPRLAFRVFGALGEHLIRRHNLSGEIIVTLPFQVNAKTSIVDSSGNFRDLFEILHRSMFCYSPTGTGTLHWKGKTYRYFVPWILDHVHTAKGMQYFSNASRDLVDLLALAQREDGLIFSQAVNDPLPGFFDTRDGNLNFYTRRDGEIRFMRQPAENHCEYNFVDCIYLGWKSSGDDSWMKAVLPNACRALDYTRNSPARWSEKFGLLKRGYTIDSWDFQVEDEYSIPFPVGTDMCIDEEKTKFGVFFGDNTGYAQACEQLGEMLTYAGQDAEAAKYRQRGMDIRERLTALAWNGRFYQHRVEEDPTVNRDLGVDEKAQIAMSNAYSLNRAISHEQSVAILDTYRDLWKYAPAGSPGEWYAIYPPFARGFGDDSGKWQYMNGGVHGHAAGELARGAFAHGRESYGVDILLRLQELARRTETEENKSQAEDIMQRLAPETTARKDRVRFAYTGAYDPAPPPQKFTLIDLRDIANMDLRSEGLSSAPGWMMEAWQGNDMRNLPTGRQTLDSVPYLITDPLQNDGRSVVALSVREGCAQSVSVPINQTAAAIYLLHTASPNKSSGVSGSCTLVYVDSAQHTEYLIEGRHFSGWWFPKLEKRHAGIAWQGPNAVCTRVGLSWACIRNPQPDKVVQEIVFRSSLEGAIYVVAGVTLADRAPYRRANIVSTGGPDNWAGGLCMAALIEGLAGVEDTTTAFQSVRISPRWIAASTDSVCVTVRYAASFGYVSYEYSHDKIGRSFKMIITGSGKAAELRLLLPEEVKTVKTVQLNAKTVEFAYQRIETSNYIILNASRIKSTEVEVWY